MAINFLKQKLNSLEIKEVKKFFIIFYSVGFLGFVVPFSRDIFIAITPLALILSFFILLWFHGRPYNYKTVIVFILIFILGFFAEVIGVETGLIFGNYWYGSALGPKILQTPVMIGVNWLMLSYSFAAIMEPYRTNRFLKIILSSTGMVVYDIALEIPAPMLDMWYWKGSIAPLHNYIAWFVIALVFQSILIFAKVKFSNPLAKTLMLCQFVFFLLLAVFYTIT